MAISSKIVIGLGIFCLLNSCERVGSKGEMDNNNQVENVIKSELVKVIEKENDSLHPHKTGTSFPKSDCDLCTIENLKKLRFASETPQKEDILNYLKCCNEACHRNVEYSQASNYSLFLLLQKYPHMLISLMQEHEKVIGIDYINHMLQNPVDDTIDIGATYSALKALSEKGPLLESLMRSLKIAQEKSG